MDDFPRASATVNRRGTAALHGGHVGAAVLSVAAAHAHAVAVRAGADTLSYAELVAASVAHADVLAQSGVHPGDFVLCAVRAGLGLPVAWLACILRGAVLVPVDLRWPQLRCQQIAQLTAARWLLMPCDGHSERFAHIERIAVRPGVQRQGEPALSPAVLAQPLLYGFFTSGSSGEPKCALNHHAGILNRLDYMSRRFGRGHVVYQNSSPVFDSSVWQLLWPLTSAGTVVLSTGRDHWDLDAVVQDIQSHGVSMTDFVPSLFSPLVQALERRRVLPSALASLRHILIGGEQIDGSAVQRFRSLVPGCEVHNTYGHTEASIGMVFHRVRDADGLNIPLGRPIDHTFVKITDSMLRPLPTGEVGEIVVGGICVGAGYLGRPELTEAAFVANHFDDVPGETVYRTGDFGRQRADGLLEFCGRSDEQVKLHGVRIELAEIEQAVKTLFPAIDDAKAFVADTGTGIRALALAYCAEQAMDEATLRQALAALLPGSHVPRLWLHKQVLPLTESGKLDRQLLVNELQALAAPLCSTRASLQDRVLAAFREVLGRHDLRLDDDFFEAGGDSLAAVGVATLLEQQLQCEVHSADIYRHPTAGSFAVMAASGQTEPGDRPPRVLPLPRMPANFTRATGPVRHVLLTGATGYVGVHVLEALSSRSDLRLHLLVRAENSQAARDRVQLACERALAAPVSLAQVEVLCGRLGPPRFGLDDAAWTRLAETVDAVLHCAAEVSFLATAAQLYAGNVLGTADALQLCAIGKPKRFCLVSSLTARHVPMTGDPAAAGCTGYAWTKRQAEQLVLQASEDGLRASIYRIDDVMPATRSGFGNSKSFLHQLLRRCVQLRVAPCGLGEVGLLTADGLGSWIAQHFSRSTTEGMYEVTGSSGYVDFRDLAESCAPDACKPMRYLDLKALVALLSGTGVKTDLLLAHMLRAASKAAVFTSHLHRVCTDDLPLGELLSADLQGARAYVSQALRASDTKATRTSV